MEKPTATQTRRDKYMTFNLSGKRYGISLSKVKEVTSFIEPTRLPNVPPYFVGLINLRGQVITLLDMAMKFGIGQVNFRPQHTCIIISSVGDRQFGFLVDEVHEVTSFAQEDYSALKEKGSYSIKHRGVHVVAKDIDGSLIPLIELESTLDPADVELFLESLHSAI